MMLASWGCFSFFQYLDLLKERIQREQYILSFPFSGVVEDGSEKGTNESRKRNIYM